MTLNYTTFPPTRMSPFRIDIPNDADKTPLGGTPPEVKKAVQVNWLVIVQPDAVEDASADIGASAVFYNSWADEWGDDKLYR